MRTKVENIMQYVPTGETYEVKLYEFHELPKDTKNRIIDEYEADYLQWVDEDFRDYNEREIWDCVRDLEKQTNCKWSYNRWYSCDFDVEYKTFPIWSPEYVEHAEDNGYYASFDICEAWNAHVSKLRGLYETYDYIDEIMENTFPYYDDNYAKIRENWTYHARLEEMRDKVHDMYIEELDDACRDVANAIQSLLTLEWEDVHSREYIESRFEDLETGYSCYTRDDSGRVYYYDSRKWYTEDGELYEESNVHHECISIVKLAS